MSAKPELPPVTPIPLGCYYHFLSYLAPYH